MVFLWGLSEIKTSEVSRTLLSILADLNHAVVWMVSSRPLIFKSSRPVINPLVTVTSAPITIDITVIFMFHSKVFVFIFLSNFFHFYTVVSRKGKVLYSAGSLFSLTLTRSSRLVETG